MSEKKKAQMVRIETDETGLMKAVTFEGKVLPVMSFTAHADADSRVGTGPFIIVDLEMMPVEFHATAKIGTVSLLCPVCDETHTHECYDGRVDDADGYSQDPTY